MFREFERITVFNYLWNAAIKTGLKCDKTKLNDVYIRDYVVWNKDDISLEHSI